MQRVSPHCYPANQSLLKSFAPWDQVSTDSSKAHSCPGRFQKVGSHTGCLWRPSARWSVCVRHCLLCPRAPFLALKSLNKPLRPGLLACLPHGRETVARSLPRVLRTTGQQGPLCRCLFTLWLPYSLVKSLSFCMPDFASKSRGTHPSTSLLVQSLHWPCKHSEHTD